MIERPTNIVDCDIHPAVKSMADLEPWRWFLEAEGDDRRDVVEALVDHVTVSRGRRGCRFDPASRLSVAWADGGGVEATR